MVCKQLGFKSGDGVQARALIRTGSADDELVWLDNVQCSGKERSIDRCAHDGWAVHNCTGDATVFAAVNCLHEGNDY